MKLLVLLLTSTLVVRTAVSFQDGGFPGYTGNIKFPEEEVRRWSETFSSSITGLVRNLTAMDHLYSEYNAISNIKVVNKEELRDNIAYEIEKLLQSKVANVERLVKHAEEVYENYTFDPELDYDFLNSKKLLGTTEIAHNQIFSTEELSQKIRSINLSESSPFNYMPINNHTSTVQVPTTVFDRSVNIMNGARWTKQLENTFKNNYERNESQTWQYFCSTDGFFRVFPGMKWPRDNKDTGIDFFDCRVRNWYLQGASGPKNVVILVDTSGSMKGLRMIIAESTVKQILNTLADDDYFNIIRFSDEVKYVDSCFKESLDLMPATKENKRLMTALIDEAEETSNQADFGKALEEVFNLFEKLEGTMRTRYGSLCNKAILLITDGVPEPYKELFAKRNWPDKRTRVFTFLIGRDVKDDREVKWMACANKGYYSHISTLADVQENVLNYITVLSRPMVIHRDHNLVWTSAYLDHISSLEAKKGLKFLTSVAMPVYDKKNETYREGNLLGVMGTDVPIDLLEDLAPSHKIGVNAYAFLINHNGYVLFHPDYKPYRKNLETGDRNLNPNYSNMDLSDVILPVNQQELNELKENMLEMAEGSKVMSVLRPYDKALRMVKRQYAFVYRKIMNTTFIFGLAIPTTFNERTSVLVLDPTLRESLNHSNVLIAPWKYCRNLDPRLKGRARVDKLVEIFENEFLREKECDNSLLVDLRSDSVLTKSLHKAWKRSAKEYRARYGTFLGHHYLYKSHGIELIFFGSKSGLTRYIQKKDGTTPRFLENKTSTIESSYYRRAVESMERLASKDEYNFTFALQSDDGFNINTSTVLITAPIVVRDPLQGTVGVAGVVGMQMRYTNFEKIYYDSHTGFRNMNCSDPLLSCYLVDDHGYIMASRYATEHNGLFFGIIEDVLMAELIRKGLFKGYNNFTDKQGVCDIEAEDASESSASSLLNPLKLVFRGLLWTITKIALCLTEFNYTHLLQRWTYAAADPEEYDIPEPANNLCDYDVSDMKPNELFAFRQLSAMDCSYRQRVIGHRPCHHKFTLYHVDFNKLIMGPLTGSIQGCEYLVGCEAGDYNCTIRFRPDKKKYVVSRINDTNLLSVVTTNDCQCPGNTYSFGLEHEEIKYSSAEQCIQRKQNRYTKKRRQCSDFSEIEDWRKCVGCCHGLSVTMFIMGLLFALAYT